MSAIWGCVDLSGTDIEDNTSEIMSACLQKYKIDRMEHYIVGNVYMSCGIQYITTESKNETLPYVNENYVFTADCIIDNRKQLINELGETVSATDGELLFEAWKKWGEDFGEHVVGLFAFAVYDKNKNIFYLYTDHTASRCVHYYTSGSKVFFGTLTTCITDAVPSIGISEKWITGCMSTNAITMLLFDGITPFEDIYILQYGSGIKVSVLKKQLIVDNIRYWNPLKDIKQIKKFDDEYCKKIFRNVHKQCVNDAIRTCGKVGILLSSGLDSSAIGCEAAKILASQNMELRSYTSIPLEEYEADDKDDYWVDDETQGVKCLCNRYPNISPSFLECKGKSVLSKIEEFCDYLEFPGKAFINHVWMSEAYEKAVKEKCKVVLNGGYGNMTISYGNLFENFYLLFHYRHFFELVRQLFAFADRERFDKKSLLVNFIKKIFSSYEKFDDDFIDEIYFKKELVQKYKIKKYWIKRLNREGMKKKSLSQRRNEVVSGLVFQLMGMYETKDGLYNGILIRDPSRDKRMIELCLKLPYKCFAWDGIDRRLVRAYLDDVVPDEIRLVNKHRGRQSGDAVIRYDKYGLPDGNNPWDVLVDEMGDYFNLKKVKALLRIKSDSENIIIKSKILACNYFLKKHKKVD